MSDNNWAAKRKQELPQGFNLNFFYLQLDGHKSSRDFGEIYTDVLCSVIRDFAAQFAGFPHFDSSPFPRGYRF
jgi:hypothetical protein